MGDGDNTNAKVFALTSMTISLMVVCGVALFMLCGCLGTVFFLT